MEFINGLATVYGSPDKGILAVAALLTPEALAAHAESEAEESVDLSKSEMVDSLKGVIQHVEAKPPDVIQPKVNPRAESVAQRRAREAKEHAAQLAESDVVARMTGRDDIEYDLENVPHRSVIVGVVKRGPLGERPTVQHYEVQPRKVKTRHRSC